MPKHPNITLLYVDDEEDNLFVFEANFKRRFQVITSLSPGEALKVLETNSHDIKVVISDMRMPGMDGLEFIKEAQSKHGSIRYYILTGFGSNPDIDEAVKEKIVNRYFTKPFNADEIEQAIIEDLEDK